jgi:hypothetical protein
MKKVISVLLAAIMMFSFTMLAFAADDETITEGEAYTYTVSADSEKELTFVPEDTGIYRLDLTFSDPSAVTSSSVDAAIYYQNKHIDYAEVVKLDLASMNTEIAEMIAEIYATTTEDYFYFVAEKGETFTVSLTGDTFLGIAGLTYDASADVNVKIEKVDAPELQIGGTYTVSSADSVFYVAPESDTVYNFTSDLKGAVIRIKDINGYYGNYYFSAEDELNCTVELEGGKAYSVTVKKYDNTEEIETGPYPFDITVSDGTTVMPTALSADGGYVVKGSSSEMYVSVLPYGSAMNIGNLEVSVANEKIATVEYSGNDNWFVVYGHKAGKTTVTFTDPISGVTTTAEIEVVTKLQDFLYTLQAYIEYYVSEFFAKVADFFSNLFNF